jgi:hypothetical protein
MISANEFNAALVLFAVALWTTWYLTTWFYESEIGFSQDAVKAVTEENVSLRVALDAMAVNDEAVLIRDETLKALDAKLVSLRT